MVPIKVLVLQLVARHNNVIYKYFNRTATILVILKYKHMQLLLWWRTWQQTTANTSTSYTIYVLGLTLDVPILMITLLLFTLAFSFLTVSAIGLSGPGLTIVVDT